MHHQTQKKLKRQLREAARRIDENHVDLQWHLGLDRPGDSESICSSVSEYYAELTELVETLEDDLTTVRNCAGKLLEAAEDRESGSEP